MGVYCYKKEAYDREPLQIAAVLGPLHNTAFSKVCVFVVMENASIASRPHYRFDAFSTIHIETLENDRIARCHGDVSWTYKHTRLRYFRSSFSFWSVFRPFSTVHTNTICMRFRFDPLSRAFSNRCVFDENAQRISVDGRPKRIEMYAFSNKNALVWWKGP